MAECVGPERRVNAVVDVRLPLDVSVDASQGEKLAAAVALVDRFDWPAAGLTCTVEDVEDGEPIEPSALSRLDALRKALEQEIERLQTKSKRNAALIHWQQADRLQEILDGTYETEAQ